MSEMRISNLQFKSARISDAESGLLGWISCSINGTLRLDGIAVRRTLDGRLALSFPARRDEAGRQHAYVRPLDDTGRRDFERQVFQALGIEDGASP